MTKKSNKRRGGIILAVVLLAILLLTQFQPTLLQLSGAADGSFGLRPISHKCAGLILSGEWVAARLRPADWQGNFGLFNARWYIPEDAGGHDFCLGQDVWFGE